MARVNVTLNPDAKGEIAEKRLPFSEFVIDDFAGNAGGDGKLYYEREAVPVRSEADIDTAIAAVKPALKFEVPNRLSDSKEPLIVKVDFSKFADFRPENVAIKIAPIQKWLELRDKLSQLLIQVENERKLQEALEKTLQNEQELGALAEYMSTRPKLASPITNKQTEP